MHFLFSPRMNPLFALSVSVAVLCLISVMYVKYQADMLHRAVQTLQRKKNMLTENMMLLDLEWAFLNAPERLERLQKELLPNLQPVTLTQMIRALPPELVQKPSVKKRK